MVEKRPKMNPSVDELHRFTLFTQILDTAKLGRDAGVQYINYTCTYIIIFCPGFLQLLFLAGATNHPIQQHCCLQNAAELYQLMVPPCGCANSYKPVAHIMWINFDGEQALLPNHLIPLISGEIQVISNNLLFI